MSCAQLRVTESLSVYLLCIMQLRVTESLSRFAGQSIAAMRPACLVRTHAHTHTHTHTHTHRPGPIGSREARPPHPRRGREREREKGGEKGGEGGVGEGGKR